MKRIILSFCMIIIFSSFAITKEKPAVPEDIARVFASSEWEQNLAEKALDQDPATRWESVHAQDPSWLAVEFKEKRLLSAIAIRWENAAARKYKIEISDNGNEWKQVELIENGLNDEERVIAFSKPVVTRYFRVFGEERTSVEYGYSIWDIILNPVISDETKSVPIISAEASSFGEAGGADKAVDNNLMTRWESKHDMDPSWLTVELQEQVQIRSIRIRWENACAKEYNIQVSGDKENWKDAAMINDGKPGENRVIEFEPVEAKYIRIFCIKRFHQWWGYSIFEIKAYR